MKYFSAPQQHFHVHFSSSVRTRLTLWYLAVMVLIMVLFGGSMYAVQNSLNIDKSSMETQLYQESHHFSAIYNQAFATQQPLATLPINLADQEIVLLLHTDGTVQDTRGPLTNTVIQQLQAKSDMNTEIIDVNITQEAFHSWWDGNNISYRFLMTPVLDQNLHVATLLVGLPLPFSHLIVIWVFHGLIALLIAAIGGYWLAGKVLRPMKLITNTANEINTTDLRRRLNLQRRDEFGVLAATFDHMLARLEAAFKRQNQFTTDASHELRTPLTIINLDIERALIQFEQPDEYKRVLQQIRGETEHMTAMVNSLLLLARADTGQMRLDLQDVDMSDIALASVERLLELARQHKITLATGDLPEMQVRGDPQFLGQMLTNLIENGIKYSSGIGKRVSVELAFEQKNWGIIRVQDDGPGISEDHIPSLFERFFRVNKARSHSHKKDEHANTPAQDKPDGTGLGLSIVEWIVLAHGGQIRVKSTIGSGSLFEVHLPLLPKTKPE